VTGQCTGIEDGRVSTKAPASLVGFRLEGQAWDLSFASSRELRRRSWERNKAYSFWLNSGLRHFYLRQIPLFNIHSSRSSSTSNPTLSSLSYKVRCSCMRSCSVVRSCSMSCSPAAVYKCVCCATLLGDLASPSIAAGRHYFHRCPTICQDRGKARR